MRKTQVCIVLILVLSGTSIAQHKGDVELSISGTLGSTSASSGGGSSDSKYAVLSVSPGVYLLDGLSIEPEIGWVAVQNESPSWLLLGNVSYTYPGIDQDHRVAPFIRVGYGLSNSYQILATQLLFRASDKLDVKVFNVGAGAKVVVVPKAFLRAEVYYRTFSWSYDWSSYNYSSGGYVARTTDYKFSSLGVLMGMSIIL